MTEPWMNIPISFPAISSEDVSEEPLIVEADVEGYLVKRVYVDEGSSVEVMFENCFENLDSRIKARLRETQMDLVGFAREISKPLGKIELEAWVKNPLSHSLHHSLNDEIPTLKGVATLVTRTIIIAECRRLEKKQMIEESSEGEGEVAATEEVLVNPSFLDQRMTIGGRLNLEAYVDDMVVKSKDEKMLLADIAETFDNLRKINMKLNPKKCSFGVEEGNFLGHMVTSEGIRANPKKTKALADLQSPRTLKEMQSLSGKLTALNHFLAKSAERSLPFSNTLKNITKENKHEYRWTKEAKEAFQKMKKLIMDLPSLTLPWEKETLYAYLAVSAEAVSEVLLTDRKGRQCPVQYVSRTLNEAERNYAVMKKLELFLIHMTRRLRRYFKAHPVKVITDQPIKNVLNNTETSGKLAKYVVELGPYNITFIPRNAVKGHVLADFLSEAMEGEKEELYF
ncbi:reverse transcriptase domain-containing protein [Tanacetum coccineum]